MQYKAVLAITGAIKCTSPAKTYQELGLEKIKSRIWYKRLSCMVKIVKEDAPMYLINFVPKYEVKTEQETAVYRNLKVK